MSRSVADWPRAILFDLDGTLIDSLPDLATALNALLAEAELAPLERAEVRGMIGHGVGHLVASGFAARGREISGAALGQATERFMALYTPNAAVETRLRAKVAPTLACLASTGLPLGVCTNKPTAVSREILHALGIGPLFGAVVGGGFEDLPKKPDPAPLHRAAELLGVAAADSLMVGDSGIDVLAARNAGMPVIAVAGGFTATPADRLGADGVIGDFAELARAFNALAARRARP